MLKMEEVKKGMPIKSFADIYGFYLTWVIWWAFGVIFSLSLWILFSSDGHFLKYVGFLKNFPYMFCRMQIKDICKPFSSDILILQQFDYNTLNNWCCKRTHASSPVWRKSVAKAPWKMNIYVKNISLQWQFLVTEPRLKMWSFQHYISPDANVIIAIPNPFSLHMIPGIPLLCKSADIQNG